MYSKILHYLSAMLLIISMTGGVHAQKESSDEAKWTPEKKRAWPQVNLKKKDKGAFFQKKDAKGNNAIIEKYEKLRKKYKLTKAEQNALASARRGYPMNRESKRLARKARRKEAKFRRKLNEFIEEQIRKSQPKEVQKRIKKSKRRSERFRRTGSYMPWYKRWWYKLTGKL